MDAVDIPAWTHNWTIAEAANWLLWDHPEFQAELPHERCPHDQRLDTVWAGLSSGCRVVLMCRRDAFVS